MGMGTLAGSTVMLLTVAWSASLFTARCDLDERNTAIDKMMNNGFSFTKQGVTLLPDIKVSIYTMLMTSLTYLVVQSADWYWGATLTVGQPEYVRVAALATMIVCLLALVGYLAFSIFDGKSNERVVRLYREEVIKRRVLHRMAMLTQQTTNKKTSDSNSSSTEEEVGKKYFNAWKLKTGTRAATEKLGLLQNEELDHGSESKGAEDVESSSNSGDKETVVVGGGESKWKSVVQCLVLLGGGVMLVTLFSDPMCDVLTGKLFL